MSHQQSLRLIAALGQRASLRRGGKGQSTDETRTFALKKSRYAACSIPNMVRGRALIQSLLGLLLVTSLADAKGGHGGHGAGHCAHAGGHANGAHVAVPHGVGSGHGQAYRDRMLSEEPRAIWRCGFNTVQLGTSPATVQHSCGAPETARQVVFADERGEHVIDVWSYQPPGSAVRILKFENGSLISVEAVGSTR